MCILSHTAVYICPSYICVLCSKRQVHLYICPHTAIYVSSYCYRCVFFLIRLYIYVLHISMYSVVKGKCTCIYVLILLYMCVLVLLCLCVLTLLHLCPRTAIYVSSYCYIYIYVLILLSMCPHTAIYMSSYCYICVLILLYIYFSEPSN
jgi:hypothetical protein